MSNDINTRVNIPKVELPATSAKPVVQERARPEPIKPTAAEVKVLQKSDPQELRRQLREATELLNRQMASNKRDLNFSVDEVTDKVVVTVKNSQSGEVVRQIPSEAALKLAQSLDDMKGFLQDEKI